MSYRVDPETGCWVWEGPIINGVPVGTFNGRRNQSARRFYWGKAHGRLSPRIHLRCQCGNKSCVNPDHASGPRLDVPLTPRRRFSCLS